jgi:hypothetical protein
LPRLEGWKFALFRVVWFLALALAAGGTIAGIHYRNVWYDSVVRPAFDLGLRNHLPGGVLGPPIGSQARAAGIVAGLRLVAIDGRALPQGATRAEIAALLDRPEGARVRIRTRSPEGQVREHVLTRSRGHMAEAYAGAGITFPQRRTIELIASLAAAAVAIVAAIMLFRRRARDPVAAMLSLAFLLLVVGTAAWETLYMLGMADLSNAALVIGYGALFTGIAVFPEGRLETRWRRVLVAGVGLSVLAGLVNVADPFDGAENLLNLSGIALLAGSVASLWDRYRRLPVGTARQQIRWVLLGFAVGGALGSAYLVSAMIGVNPNGATGIWVNMLLNIVSWIAVACWALGLLVSLLKYRLYDADAAISRSAGYAALTVMLAGTFGAARRPSNGSSKRVSGATPARCRRDRGGAGGGADHADAPAHPGLGRAALPEGAAAPQARPSRLRRRPARDGWHGGVAGRSAGAGGDRHARGPFGRDDRWRDGGRPRRRRRFPDRRAASDRPSGG